MKKITPILFLSAMLFSACISIPKETIILSHTLGRDLEILHNSHVNMVDLYFKKIKNDINTFIDDVYAPFVIHYVLKIELGKYQNEEPSLYGSIEAAGKSDEKEVTHEALQVMTDFQEAAYFQINKKRKELLDPILLQEEQILNQVNLSYENAKNANSAISTYLESVRKVKESQREALSIIGLEGTDTLITNTLVTVSEKVNEAVEAGKKIDVQSDDAYKQLEEISKKIKDLTNKK